MSPQPNRDQERLGTCLILIGTIAFSSAGVFTKVVEADAWSVIFWRGVAAISFVIGYLCIKATLIEEVKRFGWPALLASVFMATGTAAFISAFKLTSVANVSVIWATAPFVAAGLAWLTIREVPSRRIMVCSGVALLGVFVTVQGSWTSETRLGDLLAFVMTLMMAASIVIYRACPETPTKLPAAMSAAALLPVSIGVSQPFETSAYEIGLLSVFGLVFAAGSVLLMEGASRVSSAKAALISALETPLAPFWALIFLAEMPPIATILGGAFVLFAVLYANSNGENGVARNFRRLPQDSRLRRDIGVETNTVVSPSDLEDNELRRLTDKL